MPGQAKLSSQLGEVSIEVSGQQSSRRTAGGDFGTPAPRHQNAAENRTAFIEKHRWK
jgi:hypothetical protein